MHVFGRDRFPHVEDAIRDDLVTTDLNSRPRSVFATAFERLVL
jgi:hypothetical protein